MESVLFDNPSKIKKEKNHLEGVLNVVIKIRGKKISFEGTPLAEYETSMVLDAINFGFPVDTALMLKDEDFIFHKIGLKDFTRRKNRKVVRGRIIRTKGRTRQTIENLSNCKMFIKENEVGIICNADEIEYVLTGIKNLIRGSKQANVYKFLERINAQKRKR